MPVNPPTLKGSRGTCREFLGITRGWCPRPAHITDDTGLSYCWPHAGERGIHA